MAWHNFIIDKWDHIADFLFGAPKPLLAYSATSTFVFAPEMNEFIVISLSHDCTRPSF